MKIRPVAPLAIAVWSSTLSTVGLLCGALTVMLLAPLAAQAQQDPPTTQKDPGQKEPKKEPQDKPADMPPVADPKGEPKVAPKEDLPEVQESPLAQDYGFLPVELFKLSNSIASLRTADLNNDGRTDVMVANNDESRLELLLQRTLPAPTKDITKPDVNELADTWRFERIKLPVDRNVEDLATGDLNGDGRTDLVYTGNNHMVIHLGMATGEWTDIKKIRLSDESNPSKWRLNLADLNKDGKSDIVILGKGETILCYGNAEGSFEKLIRLPNTSERLGLMWARDVDGDGRRDLVYWANDDAQQPLIVRFQDSRQRFGPEYRLTMPEPRAMDLADLDGKPGDEFLSIESATGRVRMMGLVAKDDSSGSPTSPLVQFGLSRPGASRSRFMTTGDLNGDGRLDVVVVDGDTALMTVFLQDAASGLSQGVDFPGLTGIRAVAAADLDGDGRAEVVLASEREKVLALSRWREGRLTFPETLPSADPPMAMCLADFTGTGRMEIAYVASKRGATGKGDYVLRKLHLDREEGWQPGEFNGQAEIALEGLRTAPAEMLAVDADRDGRSDLLILSNNSPALFLRTSPQGVPQPGDRSTGDRLGNLAPGQVTVGQLDGEAILFAQKNFARRMGLDAKGQWTILDQYNADGNSASIAATAILDVDGDGQAEIVLIDSGTKRLRFLRKQDGVYRPWKDVELGLFGYRSLAVGDFNGDRRPDLLLFSPEKLGVVFTGQPGPGLKELGLFESKLKEARLNDLIAGDLGGGSETDVALLESGKNRIEIITPRAGAWQSALNFRVFETGSFESDSSDPREAAIADVTGDGLADLILIAHDRLLLYPQDPGSTAVAKP